MVEAELSGMASLVEAAIEFPPCSASAAPSASGSPCVVTSLISLICRGLVNLGLTF